MIAQHAHFRFRLKAPIATYAALGFAWAAFARWVVPPLLIEEDPGRFVSGLQRFIRNPPAPFITQGILGAWSEFSGAVLIALAIHLAIVVVLRGLDFGLNDASGSRELRAGRPTRLLLGGVSLVFLAVAVVTGPCQDYYLYLQMWAEVRLGHDPWFIVPGRFGLAPLNAYGPLFNLLARLAWVNPLAPKLLFAGAYLLFAISQVRWFLAGRPTSGLAVVALTALFWNPFPWVEIAIRGHFDILVGLACLGAIRAWERRCDTLAGVSLATGVLLKFVPIALVPFLAIDRGRIRYRFLLAVVAAIGLGMGLSIAWWGRSTMLPLTFAATRRSTALSIFRYIRGPYSPLVWLWGASSYDHLAPLLMFLALLRAWSWYRVRRPDIETAAVVAVTAMLLFYQNGFPQYQMVTFVLGSSWVVRHWEYVKGRSVRVVLVACYFGWLAAFDLYYAFIDETRGELHWHHVEEWVGLPAFLVGCGFLAGLVWSASAIWSGKTHSGRGTTVV